MLTISLQGLVSFIVVLNSVMYGNNQREYIGVIYII
ncbi:Uncharacterised protein [Leminorella grimontii]|nr:Uncharacterised protein [Leminorella grimontii]